MTDTHDWYVEQREAYVLQALETDEMHLFDDHLGRCEACRTAVTSLERELAPLAYGVRPAAVPPGLHRRITEAVLGPAHIRPASRMPWLVAAAALFAAAASGTLAWQRDAALRDLQGRLVAVQAREAALVDSLAPMSNASKVMQASFEGGTGKGGLVVMADERTHRWRVVVHGPLAPDGMNYLVCFITPTGLKHAVTVGRGGTPISFTLDMPTDGTTVLGAALLLEHDAPTPGAATIESPIAEVRL